MQPDPHHATDAAKDPAGQPFASPESLGLFVAIQKLGGLLHGGADIDWQESRRWCGEVLQTLIDDSPESQRLIELLEGREFFVGGDEHHVVHVEEDLGRVYKFTHGDNFGCRSDFWPHDPELTGKHFHGTGNADPFFYLGRWVLLNTVSEYQTRFEGFTPAERPGFLPRICISQPILGGVNPQRVEIREAMRQYGYIEISEDAYLNPALAILLTDMAPRNVRITEEGIPVPFDAIAQTAPRRLVEWLLGRRSWSGRHLDEWARHELEVAFSIVERFRSQEFRDAFVRDESVRN